MRHTSTRAQPQWCVINRNALRSPIATISRARRGIWNYIVKFVDGTLRDDSDIDWVNELFGGRRRSSAISFIHYNEEPAAIGYETLATWHRG
jgi:hypothetical protein